MTGSVDSIDWGLPATKEAHYRLCWTGGSNPPWPAEVSMLVSKHRTESETWASV